jgi:antitoxin component of MazEF toxin-antitoxin module
MEKKLTKHGNSLALVIERPILALLGIGLDTTLRVTTDGKVLTITPVQKGKRR